LSIRRLTTGLVLLGLALSCSVLAGEATDATEADEAGWLHSLQRFQWQARDAREAAGAAAVSAALTAEAGRPAGMSALRGDVALLDRHLTRLQRRHNELKALPLPQDAPQNP